MKKFLKGVMKNNEKLLTRWTLVCLVASFVLLMFIESMARMYLLGGFLFLQERPIAFFFNWLVIFATLSISFLFRHRLFVSSIIVVTWVGLGVANGFILTQRMTPLNVYDFASTRDAMTISMRYLSPPQFIATILGVLLLIGVVVYIWKTAPRLKTHINHKAAVSFVAVVIGGTFLLSQVLVSAGGLEGRFNNLWDAYKRNGFAYCFLDTWLNTGIRRPLKYSEESIDKVFDREDLEDVMPKDKPNIVFVQLESLIDPLTVKDVKLSEDPIPNLRTLYNTCSSGKIKVPVVGGGTANTEFEAITGMNAWNFGPGEFPYRTILMKQPVESIPYNLRRHGYSTHAIHNHTGTFYNRDFVYPRLGFDSFTPIEYMNNYELTPRNWEKDNVLTSVINDALDSTEGPDYVYAVSVQGHGDYPTKPMIPYPKIRVLSAPDLKSKWQWEYYSNQVYEMDIFVKELIDSIKERDEDTIVIGFGDHLPAMRNFEAEDLKFDRTIYETDYFIWANFDFPVKHKNLTSYTVGPYVLDRLGMKTGTMSSLYNKYHGKKSYKRKMRYLMYDMIYGKHFVYGKTDPIKRNKMRFGVNKIRVTAIEQRHGEYFIRGENFTPASKVNLKGKLLDSAYIDPTKIQLAEKIEPEDLPKIRISQAKNDGTIWTTTE